MGVFLVVGALSAVVISVMYLISFLWKVGQR